jgi:hypothetical protein
LIIPKDMPLNIRSILDVRKEKEALVQQLQQWNLIIEESNFMCPECSGPLQLGVCDSEKVINYYLLVLF